MASRFPGLVLDIRLDGEDYTTFSHPRDLTQWVDGDADLMSGQLAAALDALEAALMADKLVPHYVRREVA